MKLVLSCLAALLLFSSCVTYRLQPLPSTEKPGDFSVQASAIWAPEIQFTVQVSNRTGQAVTVDSDQFQLFVGDSSGDDQVWTPLNVIRSSEYYQREEARIRAQPTITISSTDGGSYQRTTRTTTVIGSGSSVTIIRTQPVVRPVETRTLTIVPGSGARRLEWLQENLFYSVVLQPGLTYTGLVYGRVGQGSHYKLVVPVNGKEHVVVFERIKERLFINLN